MQLMLLALPWLTAQAAITPIDRQAILLIEAQRLPPLALSSFVEHDDEDTRARAARALGRLRDSAALAGLRRLCADDSVAVRMECAFALGQTPSSPAVVSGLLTQETDPDVRAMLLEALGKVGEADAVPLLRAGLAARGQHLAPSPEPAAAAVALGRLGMRGEAAAQTPAVVGDLLDTLARFDLSMRRSAAFALARLGVTELDAAATQQLLRRAEGDRDPVVRALLVRAAARLTLDTDQQQQLMQTASKDAAVGVRIAAARAAAPLVWTQVQTLLTDEDAGVRREAISALGQLEGVDRAALLLPIVTAGATLAAAQDQRATGDSRLVEAATAIEALAGAGLLTDVETWLQPDRPTRVRAAAVGALTDVTRLITLALDDADLPVRTAAALRLTQVVDDGTQLAPLLDATDGMVAAVAADHLAENAVRGLDDQLRSCLLSATEPDLLRATAHAMVARHALASVSDWTRDDALDTHLAAQIEHHDRSAATAALALRDALGFDEVRPGHRLMAVDLPAVLGILGARIFTTRGEIRVDLHPDQAPLTVDNFAWLAGRDYFDNLVIHRVVPDFVVQDGDPRGDGYGGPGYTIPDEINPLRYDEGVLGMALAGPDTGGSQWFITLSPQPHLDGGYTAFGTVTHGLATARRLQPGDRILDVIIERAQPVVEAAGDAKTP